MSPTKKKSFTDQHTDLAETAEQTQGDVQKVRRLHRGWEAETEAMRGEVTARRHDFPEEHGDARTQFKPKPGTESAKLAEAVKARLAEQNPHETALAEAVSRYQEAERTLSTFRARHFDGILAESGADLDSEVNAELRRGAEIIMAACTLYTNKAEFGRELTIATSGIDGRNFEVDPRAQEWHRLAEEIAAAPLTPPTIDEAARWQLALQVRNAEGAENE